MNTEAPAEDLTILAAVEALERGTDGPGAPGGEPRGDEEAQTLARLYTEVLGLIPYELDAVAPSPGARERLLSAIAGDETQPAPAVPEPPRAPVPPPAGPSRPSPPAPAARAPRPPAGPAGRTGVAVRRPSRWPATLAASLAFLLLGLSGWLYFQLQQDRETIARLNQELTQERTQGTGAFAQVRRLESYSLNLKEKLALVSSPAVEISSLRPMGKPPLQPAAKGVLFVAPNHRHWYLSVQGLQPAEGGKTYKLWFMADQGPVDAGSFAVLPGAPIEMSSKQMPAGTRAAVVTLETDPRSTTPSGPEILRAGAVAPIS